MFKRLSLLLALGLLLGAVAVPLHSASAAFPGTNGRIVFRSGSDLYTMNEDGGEKVHVPNTVGAQYPAWSPDGTQVAFAQAGDIWVIGASGSGRRNLTNTPDYLDEEPAWSPEGTEIAFASSRSGNSDVYVVRVSDGSSERRLTDDPNFEGYPAWSPDGETISFTSNRQFEYGIHVMPADTGDPESYIVPTSVINVNQAWFPDGSRMAYYNSGEVWVADADGSDQTQLTTGARNVFGLAVSPDGSKIAFTSGRDGNNEIYVMDSDGSNQVNISNSPDTDDRTPDWGVPGSGAEPGPQQGTDEDDDLEGTSEPDTVFAGDGDDVISTLGGNDTVFGEGGDDTIKGGGGNDKLYGDSGPSGGSARYALRPGLQEEPPAPPGNDELLGGGGSDVAVGGGGGDVLNGGPQVDSMKGGPGKDTCVYSHKKELKRDSSCEKKKLNFKLNFNP